jgi:hypothetical protein
VVFPLSFLFRSMTHLKHLYILTEYLQTLNGLTPRPPSWPTGMEGPAPAMESGYPLRPMSDKFRLQTQRRWLRIRRKMLTMRRRTSFGTLFTRVTGISWRKTPLMPVHLMYQNYIILPVIRWGILVWIQHIILYYVDCALFVRDYWSGRKLIDNQSVLLNMYMYFKGGNNCALWIVRDATRDEN